MTHVPAPRRESTAHHYRVDLHYWHMRFSVGQGSFGTRDYEALRETSRTYGEGYATTPTGVDRIIARVRREVSEQQPHAHVELVHDGPIVTRAGEERRDAWLFVTRTMPTDAPMLGHEYRGYVLSWDRFAGRPPRR